MRPTRMPKKSKKTSEHFPCLKAPFGELNTQERYYSYAFLLSIAAGLGYGLVDTSLAQAAAREIPPVATSLAIFSHNFELAIVGVVTVGVGALVMNFITYAAASGLIALGISHGPSNHVPPPIGTLLVSGIGLIVVALLEEGGIFCFGLTGFTLLEALRKRKTRLYRGRLIVTGTIMLFLAATLESSLLLMR